MDKIRHDKRREVDTRLDFGKNSRKSRIREDSQKSSAKTLFARYPNPPERPQIRDPLRKNDGNVFGRLGHRRESAFKRLNDTYSPSTTKFGPDREYSRDDSHSRAKSSLNEEGHWKSKSKRRKPADEEDLAVPWSCEEVTDMTKVDKIEAKRTKSGTGMKRVQKIKGNGYDKSGQNQSKIDKTGHGNEKSSRNQSRRRTHLKSNPVNPLS
nr:hypothetical protein [Tanacetum cinerariifolium]